MEISITQKIILRRKRVIAAIIDWYISSVISAFPITFYYRHQLSPDDKIFSINNYSFNQGFKILTFGILVGLLYYYVVPTIVWRGQTIGKKLMKIQVVKQNGKCVTWKVMLIRELSVIF